MNVRMFVVVRASYAFARIGCVQYIPLAAYDESFISENLLRPVYIVVSI